VKIIKCLDLFSGTRSIANAFEKAGHETFTIDNDKVHKNIDWYEDILKISAENILNKFGKPDVIWASPPCTTYSVAAISHHRTKEKDGNLLAKSEFAKISDELVKHTLQLIKELNPTYWFIENPRGGLRKMNFMKELSRYTVTYCKYGDTRMKPTDIWTNHPNPQFIHACKNGDICHEAAQRGSQTGTQGLANAIEKGKIPNLLCEHIVQICN